MAAYRSYFEPDPVSVPTPDYEPGAAAHGDADHATEGHEMQKNTDGHEWVPMPKNPGATGPSKQPGSTSACR